MAIQSIITSSSLSLCSWVITWIFRMFDWRKIKQKNKVQRSKCIYLPSKCCSMCIAHAADKMPKCTALNGGFQCILVDFYSHTKFKFNTYYLWMFTEAFQQKANLHIRYGASAHRKQWNKSRAFCTEFIIERATHWISNIMTLDMESVQWNE